MDEDRSPGYPQSMAITASAFHENLYSLLDEALETGIPIEVEWRGKILRINPEETRSKLDNLRPRPYLLADPEELVHLDWSEDDSFAPFGHTTVGTSGDETIDDSVFTESEDSESSSFPWPDRAISVFRGGSQWGITVDTLEGWSLYAEGYRQAAEKLFSDRGSTVSVYLLFPMVFLYRHHIELRIKHMLVVVRQMPGPELPSNWDPNHSLKDAWSLLRPRLVAAWDGLPVIELDNVERLIDELHGKDPGSFVFRYPTDRPGKQSYLRDPNLDLNSLDIYNYFATMRQLVEILEILSACMHEVVRQRNYY
jgi:hypothetical protein